ncbi:MAG: RNA methyltransferase [Aureliella sp.]
MPVEQITFAEDERLEPFRSIRTRNWVDGSRIFVAEGPQLVQRLLTSDYTAKCVLVDEKYAPRFLPELPQELETYVVPHSLVPDVVGFKFHRGLLGCGVRKPRLNLREALGTVSDTDTIPVLVGVQDLENLGCIMRTCAGLGLTRVILGPGCCDPFARRALRVSMGAVFKLQLLYSDDVSGDLTWLQAVAGLQCVATSLDECSVPLDQATRFGPVAIFVGNEKAGLPESVRSLASHQVRIDMHGGVDSLNVSVAAGIILHHFSRILLR